MKVISLHQPNALLVAYGYQTIVTKAIDAGHRGWVAIHATSDWHAPAKAMLEVWPVPDILERIDSERQDKGWEMYFPNPIDRETFDKMPMGAIVGIAWLAKTERTNGITERWNRKELLWKLDEPDYNDVPAWEPSFSDFTNGRRAWWLCSPIPLRKPVPVRGMVGLWDTEEAAVRDRGDGRSKTPGARYDVYEAEVQMDITTHQGLFRMPSEFDEAFWRTINRRGETVATRPRNI